MMKCFWDILLTCFDGDSDPYTTSDDDSAGWNGQASRKSLQLPGGEKVIKAFSLYNRTQYRKKCSPDSNCKQCRFASALGFGQIANGHAALDLHQCVAGELIQIFVMWTLC